MIRYTPSRRTIAASLLALAVGVSSCGQGAAEKSEGEVAPGEYERGPHRGRMLRDGDFALEITLYEEGPEPLFRLYPYVNDKPVDPRQVQAAITLSRLGPKTDRFVFTAENDYLASPGVVFEPHSFDVVVTAAHAGKQHRWAYASYEGRTTIAADAARAGEDHVVERQPGQRGQVQPVLRHHHRQLLPAGEQQRSAGLGAHADPVQPFGGGDRAVGLHRDLEALRMQRVDQGRVQLQQRLATRDHDEALALLTGRRVGPERGDARGQGLRRVELAAAQAIGADEVGVAEAALRGRAILFATAPQVAAGEAAEHRGPSGTQALSLQRVEHLLDGIAHGCRSSRTKA